MVINCAKCDVCMFSSFRGVKAYVPYTRTEKIALFIDANFTFLLAISGFYCNWRADYKQYLSQKISILSYQGLNYYYILSRFPLFQISSLELFPSPKILFGERFIGFKPPPSIDFM